MLIKFKTFSRLSGKNDKNLRLFPDFFATLSNSGLFPRLSGIPDWCGNPAYISFLRFRALFDIYDIAILRDSPPSVCCQNYGTKVDLAAMTYQFKHSITTHVLVQQQLHSLKFWDCLVQYVGRYLTKQAMLASLQRTFVTITKLNNTSQPRMGH